MKIHTLTLFALVVGLLFTSSCQNSMRDYTRKAVLEVNGSILYQDDLEKITPPHLSSADSLSFIEKYKKQWIITQLVYDKAVKNIGSTTSIDKQTEAYRRELIINQYQQQLIAEKLGEISEDSLLNFYEREKNLFLLTEPYAKGIFIKLPSHTEKQDELLKRLSNITDEELEEIMRYCTQHSVQYEFFIENWEPFTRLSNLLPYPVDATDPILNRGTVVQEKDGYHYYLRILGKSDAGTPKPYEMVQPELRNILLNQEKIQFITRFHQELYEKALSQEKITYFEDANP